MNAPTRARLRVLVVDDDPVSRLVVRGRLAATFDVREASNGRQALEVATEWPPDVVLLDVEMPVMDGVTAAGELKKLAGDRLMPIFLVSGADEISTLGRGLAAGADDFLPKPFDSRVFLPKLEVFLRLRAQHERILLQSSELDAFRRATELEHYLASQLFTRIAQRASLPGLRAHRTSLTQFNGDALLAQVTPAGASRFMVADVTGHGLVAAIGSLPLSSVFYGTTARGESLHGTVAYANRELAQTLPPTLFVAAAIVEYDPATRRLGVINAGMPPVFVVRASGLVELASHSLPLGIVESLTPRPVELEVSPGDLVLAMSDGVVERSNASDVLFGLDRVRAALSDGPPALAFERLVAAVDAFSAGSDDVTVVALTLQS